MALSGEHKGEFGAMALRGRVQGGSDARQARLGGAQRGVQGQA